MKRREYEDLEDLRDLGDIMSPEDVARVEAAIAQADRDHPPTHEPVTVDGVTTVRRIGAPKKDEGGA